HQAVRKYFQYPAADRTAPLNTGRSYLLRAQIEICGARKRRIVGRLAICQSCRLRIRGIGRHRRTRPCIKVRVRGAVERDKNSKNQTPKTRKAPNSKPQKVRASLGI